MRSAIAVVATVLTVVGGLYIFGVIQEPPALRVAQAPTPELVQPAVRPAAHGDSLSDVEVARRIGRLYRYQADALEAETRDDAARREELLTRSLDELGALMDQPHILDNERFREVYRTVVTEYERYYGVPADTLVLPHGDIFALRDSAFAALNSVTEPLLEDVELPPLSFETTIPMTVNRLVEQSIAYLLRNPDKHVNQWMHRADTYFPMIEKVLEEERMPDELKYLALIESGLNPKARSWAQAVGMWQFMAATGKEYDLQVNSWVDERMDPEQSTRAAARYLRYLHQTFGDWHLALAAYNCGPGNVRKALRRAGRSASFWQAYPYLPRETRNYVPMFIAAALVTSDPVSFDLKPVAPGARYAFDEVAVHGMLSLDDAATLAGTDVATIRALNPSLRRTTLPPGDDAFKLRLPAGSYSRFATAYAELPETQKGVLMLHHTVARGESLTGIAARYGASVDAIKHANGLRSSRIRQGGKLKVPVPGAGKQGRPALAEASPRQVRYGLRAFRPIASPKPSLASASSSTTTSTAQPTPTVAAKSTTPASTRVTYRVRRGDTLGKIARKYGVSVGSLQRWNGLRSSRIRVGQRLSIHPGQKAAPSYITYRVRRGDSLSKIGSRHGVSISSLKRWNGLRSSNIRVGQQLRIYS